MYCFNCSTHLERKGSTRCTECSTWLHKECSIQGLCDVCLINAGERDTVKVEIPEIIRRSYIETYKKCPHKFLKQVLEDNPMPANIYTQLGIDLHEEFEKACNDRAYSIEEMRRKFEEYWDTYGDELFVEYATREKMYARGHESIVGFYNVLETLPIKPFATEETLRLNIGEGLPNIQITMDRIDMDENVELHIHDWKTGKVIVGKKISSDLQPPLYIKLVGDHYGKNVKSFNLWYVNEGKSRHYYQSEKDPNVYVCTVGKRPYYTNTTDAIREVQHLFSQIVKGNFNIPRDTKNLYYECKMCHIKELGLCSGAEEQSWKNVWGGKV